MLTIQTARNSKQYANIFILWNDTVIRIRQEGRWVQKNKRRIQERSPIFSGFSSMIDLMCNSFLHFGTWYFFKSYFWFLLIKYHYFQAPSRLIICLLGPYNLVFFSFKNSIINTKNIFSFKLKVTFFNYQTDITHN